jgi:hypothetical protein
MTTEAFTPAGKTTAIAVTAASQAVPVDFNTPINYVTQQYIMTVVGSQPVTLAYGASAPTAIIPVAGTPQFCIVLPGDSSQTYSFPQGTYFAAIAAAAGSTLYMTAGAGV